VLAALQKMIMEHLPVTLATIQYSALLLLPEVVEVVKVVEIMAMD
jgi:hypothetical protein